ncbi:Phosphoserine phosphatase [Marinobacterium lacunae]|uniref:Histidinol-phosphatase n=1 Tax=Marinobacterium lacunae TaxID=1232683 RepID=A0A081FY44_9GAMM|nr:HAD family hydrolase [Marinobacterium lacunae]KEA63449.1 Phosphoserine phosphatase [Marinobacterium lacunae]MBR9885036.1 HAD family hydrolase [Oceanospirillales bacterium]
MRLAIFDLDNTLINGDSDHAWGEFLCQRGIVDEAEYRAANDHFFRQYQSGALDIHEFLNFALRPLANHAPEQLQSWHDEFMQECIEPMMLPAAQALLEQHRQAGDYLLIITATNSFVTAPIAARLGVDGLLATEPERVGDRFTGRVAGTPCFQGGKVVRLNAWLEETGYTLAGSSFYSDSHNDLPLLEQVERPYAVNPDDRLREVATERNWPILDLRV